MRVTWGGHGNLVSTLIMGITGVISICWATDENHLPRVQVPMLSDPEGLDRTLDPEGLER